MDHQCKKTKPWEFCEECYRPIEEARNKKLVRAVDKYRCSCDPEHIHKNGYGTGYNTIVLNIPEELDIRYNRPENDKRKTVSVDSCLAFEIKELWRQGIRTAGCCCGHNVSTGFIQVVKKDIPKMKKLGYRRYYYGGQQHDRDDAFLPKTLYP